MIFLCSIIQGSSDFAGTETRKDSEPLLKRQNAFVGKGLLAKARNELENRSHEKGTLITTTPKMPGFEQAIKRNGNHEK